ncbi:MAG: hypothetical protein Q9227_003944 [Pyrenula ochraceoflavens]
MTPQSEYGLLDASSNQIDSRVWESLVTMYLQQADVAATSSMPIDASMLTIRLAKIDVIYDEDAGSTDSDASVRASENGENGARRLSRWDAIREQIKQVRLKRQAVEALRDGSDDVGQTSPSLNVGKRRPTMPKSLFTTQESLEEQSSRPEAPTANTLDQTTPINTRRRISEETSNVAAANVHPTRPALQPELPSRSGEESSAPASKSQSTIQKLATFNLEQPTSANSQQDLLGLVSDEEEAEDSDYPDSILQSPTEDAKHASSSGKPVIKPLFRAHGPDLGEIIQSGRRTRSQGPVSEASGSARSVQTRSSRKFDKEISQQRKPHHRRHISESPVALPDNGHDSDPDFGLLSNHVRQTSQTSPGPVTHQDLGKEKSPMKSSLGVPVTARQKKLAEAARRLNSMEHVTNKPIYCWPVERDKQSANEILYVHHCVMQESASNLYSISQSEYLAIKDRGRQAVEDAAGDCAIAADKQITPSGHARFLRMKCDVYIIAQYILHCFVDQGVDSPLIHKYWGMLHELCELDFDKASTTYFFQ